MLEFLRKQRLSLVILITLLGLLLVVFRDQKSPKDSILQQSIQTLVHPAQALAHWIVIEVGGRIDGYINLVDTKAENRQLQQRIAALQAQGLGVDRVTREIYQLEIFRTREIFKEQFKIYDVPIDNQWSPVGIHTKPCQTSPK